MIVCHQKLDLKICKSLLSELGSFWRTSDGRVFEERRCFRKMTSFVFYEEKRKPRFVAHADIMFRVCWRSSAALDGLEAWRDTLKSSAKRRWERGKVTH